MPVVCDCVSCVHIPPSEAPVHHSPGYGLFEESPSHMLTQFCAPFVYWSPPPPLFSFLQYPCHPPLSLFLIYLLSITLSHSPSLIGPSLVTGMLTGTVYNKKEDKVLTLSVANISNQQSSFHRPMTKSKLLLYSKSHISRPCSI